MTSREKLPLREKLCFGCGDFASVLYWQTFMVYLLYFYTDVFGLSAAAAGTMILISRLWNGVDDPIMGMIADRTHTRWGKFRPYLLWICVPFALAGVLAFTTPNLGAAGRLLWAYLTYNALMMLYTAINIPYTALLGVISPDPKERTQVSSIKFIFAFAAGTVVSATLLPMTKILGGTNVARGWQWSFVIYGLVAIAFFLVAFRGTRERVQPPPAQRTSVWSDLRDLVSNGPWLILLAATITFILFVATRSTAKTHYFKYYIGIQEVTLPFLGGPRTYSFETLVSAFNTVGQVAAIAGALLVMWFANWVGKKRAFLLLFVAAVASTSGFYFLRPDQLVLVFTLQILASLTGGPLSVLLWAMYADAADYGEWRKNRRSTGLVFSASTMAQKWGWAVGGATAAWVMGAMGFRPNVAQTAGVQDSLVLLVSLIPAGVGVISILLMLFYPLNDARMRQIEADLAARRVAAEAASRPAA